MTSYYTDPPRYRLAARSTRLIAQCLDFVIAVTPMLLSVVVLGQFEIVGFIVMVPAAAWSVYYWFLGDSMNEGQGIAKGWLGLRVVHAVSGAPCTVGQSLVRNLCLYIAGPFDWIFIIGSRRQRLGDKIASTAVVIA